MTSKTGAVALAAVASAERAADGEGEDRGEARTVERARNGDRRAFERLYRAEVGKVYGLCLRMCGNVAEAEDCTQEAFIAAWRKLAKFRGESAFGTWLHRIAVNTVLGRARKRGRERDHLRAVESEAEAAAAQPGALDGDAAPAPGWWAEPAADTAVDSAVESARQAALESAIAALPPRARHVLVLHAVYGYTHEETGELLDIAAGTCKAQVHRARRLLSARLASGDGG